MDERERKCHMHLFSLSGGYVLGAGSTVGGGLMYVSSTDNRSLYIAIGIVMAGLATLIVVGVVIARYTRLMSHETRFVLALPE
jgi:hypothetical protein